MKKRNLVVGFASILLVACGKNDEKIASGLTKSAEKVTEFMIRVSHDSTQNKTKYDTIRTEEIFYDEKDLVSKKIQTLNYGGHSVQEFTYAYMPFNKIAKETVKSLQNQTQFEMNYVYNDTILSVVSSELDNGNVLYVTEEKYIYDADKKLTESKLINCLLEKNTRDTIGKQLTKSMYDDRKNVILKVMYPDGINVANSTKFQYENKRLKSMVEFDANNNLVSTTNYEYELDQYGNEIKRTAIENGKVLYIVSRKIDYR